MADDDKVLSFPVRAVPECPVEVVNTRNPGKFCLYHMRIRLDVHKRVVECADCGQILDPFDYIAAGAQAIRRGWQEHAHVESLIREKRDQVTALDKERKRLQPILKRMREKVGTNDGTLDLRKPE